MDETEEIQDEILLDQDVAIQNKTLTNETLGITCSTKSKIESINVPFPIFVGSLMDFLGWLMLIFYFPVGMWKLVFDCFDGFAGRPRKMNDEQFKKAKEDLHQKIRTLMEHG